MLSLDSPGVLLALMVNDRWNIKNRFLGFHNAHEPQAHKQSVIRITVLACSRVSRPLGNGEISAFLRPDPLGITQIVGVGFPTIFAKLLVNQIAGLGLGKLHALGCGFAFLCTLLGGLRRCRSGYCLDLFGERGDLFLLLFDNRLIVRLHYIFRHDKIRGNISPVAIYLHEPNREVVGHGEKSFGVLYGVGARMDSVISGFAKRIQDVVDFLGKQTFPFQQTNSVCVGIIDGWLLDMLKSKDFQDQALTKHAQFVQTGVSIRIDIVLRCCTNLCQCRPISVEKFKVRFHMRPPNFSNVFDNLVLSEVHMINFTRILSQIQFKKMRLPCVRHLFC